MKILVTGANGQLGMSLRRVLPAAVFTDVTPGPDTRLLDITDLAAVREMVHEEGIGTLINCAAFTNVDAAEGQPELAYRLNVQAVENLAIAMKEVDGLLVHISTDYIFGGEAFNTPIPEDAVPAPLGVYGRTKWEGEEAIRQTGCRSLIIRTAWLYSEYGKNFVKTMLRLTAERPQLKVVFDQVGTPTYAGDLAEAIGSILEHPAEGVFNYTDEGVCSWYDFAKAIAAYAGQTACDIQPCHSDEFPSPVRRPAYSVLDKSKIKATSGLRIPHWQESLGKLLLRMRYD